MRTIKTIVLLLFIFLLTGCNSEELVFQLSIKNHSDTSETLLNTGSGKEIEKGIIRIKFSEKEDENLFYDTQSGRLKSSQTDIELFLQSIGAESIERVFPNAGKFEARTRKEGLHLWYDITFDKTKPITRATSDARLLSGIDIVEEIYNPTLPPTQIEMATLKRSSSSSSFFNDPFLDSQWHYHNIGDIQGSSPGADINLFKAWEVESGKPDVIVAIVDGGLDTNHEDLKDNLWINQYEFNGLPNVDDDNNGFLDDIYGYNFVSEQSTILPHSHGTHVGGTVAARNNNEKGVAGVAGGDGSPHSGIRMISCQIFEHTSDPQKDRSGNTAAAIKYGADNGAVISQNSWGYEYPGSGSMPASLKAAVDYFIKYAGCDNEGNQLPNSPMKGGVVIFAAGNDNEDYKAYPAAYPPIISVSAMAPNYKKSWYTNRGDWITIMAPGGDNNYPGGMVLSTLPNNSYGYMQGTSMASPHVSGVAALIISKYGGQGFTNEALKQHITLSLLPVDINEINPDYSGRLGKGYIDAEKSLAKNSNKSPENIASVELSEGYKSIDITWGAVLDEDDGTASYYKLYYSNTLILNDNNYQQGKEIKISGSSYKPGDKVNYTLEGLSLDTHYSFVLIAEDRWGLQSAPLLFLGKTKVNLPPVLSRSGDNPVRITGYEISKVMIEVFEPDGQEWNYTVTGETNGVTFKKEKSVITLSFTASGGIGKHSLNITVTDIYQATETIEITYEIYENHPPRLIKTFEKEFIPISMVDYPINLNEYFTDDDGHDVSYMVRSLNTNILQASISNNLLHLNPLGIGISKIEITAIDSHNSRTTTTANFQIASNDLVYLVYPVPVNTILNIRLGNVVNDAIITISTNTGRLEMKKNMNVNNDKERLVQLDVSWLSGGTYILQVDANGRNYKQLFIKY
ncbi:MAG: S8 family serine peptidase [Dysgonamonadaceae bacterium]